MLTRLSERSQTTAAYPWTPDQSDGSYRNPVLYADYSDPDVIAVGEDFYLTASSFNCTPGLPILHSRDLVNWELINHAIREVPGARYATPQHGCGVWAPAIRFHDGRFWIFFPTPDEGIYVTTATDAAGRWSEPHLMAPGRGLIDPCPLWDDDGKAYLVHAYANSRCGIKHRLRVCPMEPDGSRLLGDGHVVYDNAKRHPTLEGPKFHKRDGYYYISAPAGGVATGWQVVFRSRHVYGPYEDRVELEQGASTINGPHQGALVETTSGESWFVHFQDADVYGRIVHLQPVEWRDGWPHIGVDRDGNGIGEPVDSFRKPVLGRDPAIRVPATSDEFDGQTIGLQWQWHANHEEWWASLQDRRGHLRLRAVEAPSGFASNPALLLQKFPAEAFAVETEIDPGGLGASAEAGLVVMGLEHAAWVIDGETQTRLRLVVNDQTREEHRLPASATRLRVTVQPGGLCRFAYMHRGEWITAQDAFQATKGHWIGAKVGLFCRASAPASSAFADVAYFRFAPPVGSDHDAA